MIFLMVLLLADWPQFLGPERNGTYEGPPVRGDAPKLVWQTDVGAGFAGPVVVGERVIVFHRKEDREIVETLDRKTGQSVWRHDYPTSYRDDFGFDEGPRSVPVVANGVVYTFGAQGVLSAVELETGKELWSVDTRKRFRVVKGFFGAAGSPVVEDGRVILNVGGRDAGLAAFDGATGELLWTAGKDEASYSSAVTASFEGKKLALFFTRDGLVAVDPATDEEKYRLQWRSRSRASVNAASPLVVDNVVFLSASYGTGAIALAIEGGGLETLWSGDESLSNHYATSVHRDGVLYGFRCPPSLLHFARIGVKLARGMAKGTVRSSHQAKRRETPVETGKGDPVDSHDTWPATRMPSSSAVRRSWSPFVACSFPRQRSPR